MNAVLDIACFLHNSNNLYTTNDSRTSIVNFNFLFKNKYK